MGMVDMSTSDGRFLFFLPWEDHVVVGTTDHRAQVLILTRTLTRSITLTLNLTLNRTLTLTLIGSLTCAQCQLKTRSVGC